MTHLTAGRVLPLSEQPVRPRAKDVIDATLKFHDQDGQSSQPPIDVLLAESFAIADGKSRLMGTTAHVTALVRYIRETMAESRAAIDTCLRDHKG